MEQSKAETTSIALETIITNAVKIPGVKSNLTTTFFPKPERLSCALCMSR